MDTNDQKAALNAEKTAVVSKFASIVSHEMRNPLSSLKNIAYYLIKTTKSEDPKTIRMMEMLSSEVDRVNRMLTEFSNISHAKRIGKLHMDVSELLENTLAEYSSDATLEITKDITPRIKTQIDPERIAVALRNIIKNARQASPEKCLLNISLKQTNTWIELTIKDSGPGMENEVVEHIFDPMFTTKTKSLGMGLTVVKETIEAHDGKVEVETAKDKGSLFRILLPLEQHP